jgi:alanyl-tRNA synthetase
VDEAGFETPRWRQREPGPRRRQVRLAGTLRRLRQACGDQFIGYEKLGAKGKVVALYVTVRAAVQARRARAAWSCSTRTPFYAESGGQVGDHGQLISGSARFEVPTRRSSRPTSMATTARGPGAR